ncbi:hypothetical protein NVP1177O_17 [Vibrio phage 1.177.O._10N.286.45.E10]|nr:hypothetical protein NVP1177O_17 [Vibrio phage 1.177.O._10N.286.45.E10]
MTYIDAIQGLVNELCAYMIEHEDFDSFEYVSSMVDMFDLDDEKLLDVEDAM